MEFESDVLLTIDGYEFDYKLFNSLKAIGIYNSQRKSAKELNIAHTVLNRRIKKAEEKLNVKLVEIKGSNSFLTNDALNILNSYEEHLSRIKQPSNITVAGGHIVSGLIEVLAKEGKFEVDVYSSDDERSYKLAQRNLIDILALDDPIIAFREDLDFTPIAFDHLVLVSKDNNQINSLNELKESKFISVANSSQRLAWKILKDHGIDFEIVTEVKSPYEAYKLVKNTKNIYTFLNASFFTGQDILMEETHHVISLVNLNESNPKNNEFINYILNDGQDKLEKYGFEAL